MSEPTIGEVVRRLDDIVRRLDEMTTQLRTDYVRADLYISQREADRDDVADQRHRLDAIEKQRAADRRLIITAFVAPIITSLLVLYVVTQLGGSTP